MGTGGPTMNGLLDTEAAIQPFLYVLKDEGSLKVSTLRSLVINVLIHPDIFCGFDQLKQQSLDAMQDGETAAAIANTLDLFSYGGLKEYNEKSNDSPDFFLPLNESAIVKLGQLSLLTCIQDACFKGRTHISYLSLAESLGWINTSQSQQDDSWIRKVEDILIRCVYSESLKGKLCQKSRCFSWQSESLPIVCARDIPPSRIPQLSASLQGLFRRLEIGETELGKSQGQVARALAETEKVSKSLLIMQKQAQSESGKKTSQGFGLASLPHGAVGGALTNRASGRSSAPRSSNKRSRGGGSFANESAFRI